MLALDSVAAENDIPAVSTPFFEQPHPRSAGIQYYQGVNERLPQASWVRENIARLMRLASQTDAGASRNAAAAGARASSSDSSRGAEQALMGEGLGFLERGGPAAAASVFRRVLATNPSHYGAHYQLATALDLARKPEEARHRIAALNDPRARPGRFR